MHLGYQVYDASCAVDAEWDEFFGGSETQVADHGVGEMRVCFGGIGG